MTAQTILPANSATAATGYNVANSLRFNESDDCLIKTFGSAGNTKLWTYSVWFKRGKLGGSYALFVAGASGGNDESTIRIEADKIDWQNYDVGTSAQDGQLLTNQLIRDPSAWYHLVCAYDSANSTAGNRMRMYLNGSEVTSFATDNNSSVNYDSATNSAVLHNIGRQSWNSSADFDGYMAEICFIDGAALTPTSFGEFDGDSPTIWKPLESVEDLTFGDNGFYLEFKESGTGTDANGMGADTSGEDNHFAVNNLTAIDQSTDTCTNNGCTWNILYRNTATFTEGNLVYTAPSSNPVFGSLTTFGVTAGKWYAECKYHAGSNHYGIIGIADEVFATLSDLGSATNTDLGKVGASLGVQAFAQNSTVAYVINTGKIRNNNSNQNYGSGGGDGQIINIALDRDNRKVYFGINGTYENSGDPGAGSNGFDISGQVTGNEYFLGVTNDTGSSETILDFNFGSGFGLTAVSSANTDANGYGNFEYAVPSGFFAWNTKNLAEHG